MRVFSDGPKQVSYSYGRPAAGHEVDSDRVAMRAMPGDDDVPPMCTCDIFISAMTWRWLRMPLSQKKSISLDGFRDQQTQFALIWALVLSVVSAGLFSMSDMDWKMTAQGVHQYSTSPVLDFMTHLSGFFFCSSEIALVFAVFGCLLLMLASRTVPTDHEFHALYALFGSSLLGFPMAMGVYGVLAAFCGLIAYFAMIFSETYTMCCLGVCAASFPVMIYAIMTLTRAVQGIDGRVSTNRTPNVRNAAEIYARLKDYWLDCDGSLERVQRGKFLESIGCAGEEDSMICLLAREIYDDWMSKKLRGMLKANPSF